MARRVWEEKNVLFFLSLPADAKINSFHEDQQKGGLWPLAR